MARVGHVDEFVQFIPFENNLGFTIPVASPDTALALLEEARTGHGDSRVISFDAEPQVERFKTDMPTHLNMMINDALSNSTFLDVNAYAQKWINHNVDILLSEITLDHEDVVHVPGLYRDLLSSGGTYVNPDGLDFSWPPVLEGEYQLGAFLPGSINGIVAGNQYLSPNPFGPVVDGVDILARGVEKAYAWAGMDVTFINDFFSHHTNGGEAHCGSNTLRQTDMIWWK